MEGPDQELIRCLYADGHRAQVMGLATQAKNKSGAKMVVTDNRLLVLRRVNQVLHASQQRGMDPDDRQAFAYCQLLRAWLQPNQDDTEGNRDMAPKIDGLDYLVLTVANIEKTVEFYTQILGMEVLQFRPTDGTVRFALKFGRQKINLHQAGREFDPKAANPVPGSVDICFLSVSDVTDWLTHMASKGIQIEKGPVNEMVPPAH